MKKQDIIPPRPTEISGQVVRLLIAGKTPAQQQIWWENNPKLNRLQPIIGYEIGIRLPDG